MRFKTIIEIVSEAENKNEAMEIADEYLSGYLTSGVDMRCSTKRLPDYRKPVIGIIVTSLILIINIALLTHIKSSKNFTAVISGVNAVQPPLKTHVIVPYRDEFKKEWETKQIREALNHIKK